MSKLFYITHADVDCHSYFFLSQQLKGTGRCEQVKKNSESKKKKKCHRACILNRIAFAQAAAQSLLKLQIFDRLGAETRAGSGLL